MERVRARREEGVKKGEGPDVQALGGGEPSVELNCCDCLAPHWKHPFQPKFSSSFPCLVSAEENFNKVPLGPLPHCPLAPLAPLPLRKGTLNTLTAGLFSPQPASSGDSSEAAQG